MSIKWGSAKRNFQKKQSTPISPSVAAIDIQYWFKSGNIQIGISISWIGIVVGVTSNKIWRYVVIGSVQTKNFEILPKNNAHLMAKKSTWCPHIKYGNIHGVLVSVVFILGTPCMSSTFWGGHPVYWPWFFVEHPVYDPHFCKDTMYTVYLWDTLYTPKYK